MPVAVRRAGPRDRTAVLGFHRALYQTHRDRVLPEGMLPLVGYRDFDTVLREDVEAMLANPEVAVLLAERDGVPIGYVTGHVDHDPRRLTRRRGIVGDWYVDESARGLGVGKQLIDLLTAIFREAGCDAMESATWAFNDGARRAHLALGFREVQITYRKPL